jgi:pseudaminic acid synthase
MTPHSPSEKVAVEQCERIFLVAEISANHNRSFERAKSLIQAAADAGADAVKLQTYTADTLTIPCDNEYFRIKGTLWEGRTLYDLYQEAYTPWEWTPRLMALAGDLGIDCFSTPFDASSVDFLESCGVSRYKIASFEVVDIPLLQKVAATGKPVILSTGMANLSEIDEAVRTLRTNGTNDLTLLKCTSTYPAPLEEINLRTIPHLAQAFDCPVGLSDHTLGSAVAIAAVALGARVIEKHFTLSRSDGGPDGAFSMEPEEFKQMVRDIRAAEKALGHVSYALTEKEKEKESIVFRRSLFVVKDVERGEPFTQDNVRSIRPGYGLHTRFLNNVINRRASISVDKGTPLSWNMIN